MRLAETPYVVERPDPGGKAADSKAGCRNRNELVGEVPRRVTAGNGFRIATPDDREIRRGMKAERGLLARPVHER